MHIDVTNRVLCCVRQQRRFFNLGYFWEHCGGKPESRLAIMFFHWLKWQTVHLSCGMRACHDKTKCYCKVKVSFPFWTESSIPMFAKAVTPTGKFLTNMPIWICSPKLGFLNAGNILPAFLKWIWQFSIPTGQYAYIVEQTQTVHSRAGAFVFIWMGWIQMPLLLLFFG